MASAVVLGVIGAIGTVFTIVGFGEQNHVPDNSPKGTSVMIRAGAGYSLKNNMGGVAQNVFGYNVNNAYLGKSGDNTKVPYDGAAVVVIDQEKERTSYARYLDLIVTEDTICVAFIAATMPGGDVKKTWLGDIGMACGQAWYYSRVPVGTKDGSSYMPACTWLSARRNDVSLAASVKIDMYEYTPDSGVMDPNKNYCEGTIFSNSTKPLNPKPPGSSRVTSDEIANTLVVSSFSQHSATALCNSSTSYGSDFVSVHEGYFCEMATKTIYPICLDLSTPNCFSLDSKTIVLKDRNLSTSDKSISYTNVELWNTTGF